MQTGYIAFGLRLSAFGKHGQIIWWHHSREAFKKFLKLYKEAKSHSWAGSSGPTELAKKKVQRSKYKWFGIRQWKEKKQAQFI